MSGAVAGIDLTVEEGEFVAFLGPNGAGKTTTLKLLSGVINPTSGTAQVMGYTLGSERTTIEGVSPRYGQKISLWDLPARDSYRFISRSTLYRKLNSSEHWTS